MITKTFLLSIFLFLAGHIIIWAQLNGQFVKPEFYKKYEWLFVAAGIPVSYIFLKATKYGVESFDGILWPQRLIGFAIGIIIFSFLTNYILHEGITPKTVVCLCLATVVVLIQLFWK
jgi:hypothetical protein